jgi:predicted ATPase
MWRGRLDAGLPHLERALALLHPADRELPVYFGQSDSRITCLGFAGLVRLYQGYPDQALARMREALAAADELGQAYSTCQALYLSCWLHHVRGEPEIVLERTAELIAVAEEKKFPSWAASGIFFRGWALAAEGEVARGSGLMVRGLAARQTMAIGLQLPYYLGLLAGVHMAGGNPTEALARLDEAMTAVEKRDERWFEAELHRLRGEALLRCGDRDPAAAEACFLDAIAVARSQGARWWELRASRSLARLWAERGERHKAHDLLAPVYGWFTEGFDTREIKAAKALLDRVADMASHS